MNPVIENLLTRRSVLTEWGIPANHVVYGMAALGYPASSEKKAVEKIGKTAVVR